MTEVDDSLSVDGPDPNEMTWLQSVRYVTRNSNWTIYLLTVWIYSSLNVLYQYFNLFFRDIGISYIEIGLLLSGMFGIRLVGNFVSGYLADNYDRRKLSVFTMAVSALGYLFLVFADGLWLVVVAMATIGLASFTGTAGIAYQMQQVDRKFGGVAQSLFNLGNSLGLIPLYVISNLLSTGMEFVPVMRLLLLFAAILYFIAASVRAFALESIPLPKRHTTSDNLLRDFIGENIRGLRLLVRVFPVFVGLICVDALSDSFYQFANTYYLNETLEYTIGDINLMFLITLLISVPLTLYLGRFFDKHGGRKLTVIVYGIMPISIILLIAARFIPYYTPLEWVASLNNLFPGLGVVLTLAFLATAMKSINDTLWFSVLGTYIQKSLPRQDLGKLFSLTNVLVLAFIALGPIPAGWIYSIWQGLPLLVITLFLNIGILIVLVMKSIEPRISVEELEEELRREERVDIQIVEDEEKVEDVL